jgi:diguanylate cyclase (GGDEF)-like protein
VPDDCWALRRGQPHLMPSAEPPGKAQAEPPGRTQAEPPVPRCAHLAPGASVEALCVPLTAQSQALGLLHLQADTQEPDGSHARRPEDLQPLAGPVAEQVALALSNLALRETLRNQAIRDPLTGLFNRRYLEETLERELARAARSQQPLGLIMLDLDHFKDFNDTFGHAAGDAVLRELGRYLKTHTRGGDIACRYGGEEFTLLLPECPPDVLRERAEQIRDGARQLQVQHRGQLLGMVTVSLGLSHFPAHGAASEALLHLADAALYQAKRQGRDRVVIAALGAEAG